MIRKAALALALLATSCATPPEPALEPAITIPAEGVRLGVMVATLSGETVFADKAGQRFIPASNTKLFETWQWQASFAEMMRVATNVNAQVFVTVNYWCTVHSTTCPAFLLLIIIKGMILMYKRNSGNPHTFHLKKV